MVAEAVHQHAPPLHIVKSDIILPPEEQAKREAEAARWAAISQALSQWATMRFTHWSYCLDSGQRADYEWSGCKWKDQDARDACLLRDQVGAHFRTAPGPRS